MGLIITPEEIEIRDEGAVQGNANVMDFVGAGVAATVSGDIATITISGGGSFDYPQVLFAQIFS